MTSRGKVKYDQLKNESEAKASNRRILVLKCIHCCAILAVFSFFILIYIQDYSKASDARLTAPNAKLIVQSNKSEGSDQQNPTSSVHLPSPQTTHVYHKSTSPPAPKACGVQVNDSPVIKVGNLNTYVIGSYMDHRFGEEQIRTTAIVLRAEQVTYRCVMCCQGRNVTSPASYAIHSDHFGFEYGTATITCQTSSLCSTPTHVAVTAAEISDSITTFQTIKNRDVPKVFPYTFTVCISVMYDYKNVLNLVESMEMFRLLGAQKVVIYKTSCDSGVQKVLDYYVQTGFLEIVPWTVKKHINVSSGWLKSVSTGQLHYYAQIPALNDCVYRYMYQSRYVALHDMDELILPLKVKTWTQLLPELERIHGTSVGFGFENNAFPFNAKAHTKYNQDKWKNVPGINILNYIGRVPIDKSTFDNFKTIVNPRIVMKATVHGLLETTSFGRTIVMVSSSLARMYHMKYIKYATDAKLIEDYRLWDYSADLIPAVSKVLLDCGFIEASKTTVKQ